MQEQIPDRTGSIVAGCFALAAFAVVIVTGLAGGIETSSILRRSFFVMIGSYPLGFAAGWLCRWVIHQHENPAGSAKAAHGQLAVDGEGGIGSA
jgi:NhaP-type Na+/H+ or K+/H+ antiporter